MCRFAVPFEQVSSSKSSSKSPKGNGELDFLFGIFSQTVFNKQGLRAHDTLTRQTHTRNTFDVHTVG